MTDNEFIKVFKYCILDDAFNDCHNCGAYQDGKCTIPDLGQEILQLFDRQRAEIERLKDYNENLITANTELSNEILEVKSEAIKEFAERLKKNMRLEDGCEYDCRQCCYECKDYVPIIDSLAKEMTEVEE